jgi:hypothetical protein
MSYCLSQKNKRKKPQKFGLTVGDASYRMLRARPGGFLKESSHGIASDGVLGKIRKPGLKT